MHEHLTKRFFKHVNKTPTCWLWTGSRTNKREPYGRFWIKPKCIRAHRISWEIHQGKIPKNMGVLHKCDVTFCVNPSHLFLGTPFDNARDRHNKKRDGFLKGESNPIAKLKDQDIFWIRENARPGKYPYGNMQKIANHFKVSRSVIWAVFLRKRWTHI